MKKVRNQVGTAIWIGLACLIIGFVSCKKGSDQTVIISTPLFKVGTSLKPGNISGTIKGTFLADSVYNVTGDLIINKGDTVLAQQGAKIYFSGNYNIWIHGNLISLGTKADPVYFTVKNLAASKTDVVGQDPTTDIAYQGTWGGLQVDSSARFVIIKWTHIEFGGGKIATSQVFGVKNNATAWLISFASPNGMFILEDSWLYGGVDDPIRIQGGKIHIFRNTSEKGGFTGGEGIGNIKSGTQGNIAYNMIIGPATSGIKPSNNGGRTQTNIITYNNTVVNGGYRRFIYGGAGNSLGRGGSINYEEGAEGQIYNNLMVDCKFGLRVVGTGNYLGNALVIADTLNLKYGYNYNYGDSLSLVNQFYPTAFLTKPQATNIPAPSTFLPAGYTLGSVYNAPTLVGQNDPKFVNYPLPITYSGTVDSKLTTISFVKGYDFHLQAGSPAIGKGTTSFTPLSVVPIDAKFGATELTAPGSDIGAYQSNGKGNQH